MRRVRPSDIKKGSAGRWVCGEASGSFLFIKRLLLLVSARIYHCISSSCRRDVTLPTSCTPLFTHQHRVPPPSTDTKGRVLQFHTYTGCINHARCVARLCRNIIINGRNTRKNSCANHPHWFDLPRAPMDRSMPTVLHEEHIVVGASQPSQLWTSLH